MEIKKLVRCVRLELTLLKKNIHYCAECYSLNIWKKPLAQVGQDLARKDGLRLKVVKP